MSIKRTEIYKFIDKSFGIKPEFPFTTTPTNAVFREKTSEKWFALLMDLDASKFRLEGGEKLILNLKCDSNLVNILINYKEFFPAYHMNKKHWISLNLSSDIEKSLVFDLIKESFKLVSKSK